MTLQTQLDTLRAYNGNSALVAFGDLVSKLVLRTSSDASYPREDLDTLARCAADLLTINHSEHEKALLARSAIMFDGSAAIVFTTHPDSPDEFLCTMTGAQHSIEHTVRSTKDAINTIAHTEI
ncbi:MAG: hypothetical protein AB8B47_14085 [Roseobacter sp.]